VGPPAIGFISQVSSLRVGLSFVVFLSALAACLVSAVRTTSASNKETASQLSPAAK
jgi:hypothetical protein